MITPQYRDKHDIGWATTSTSTSTDGGQGGQADVEGYAFRDDPSALQDHERDQQVPPLLEPTAVQAECKYSTPASSLSVRTVHCIAC